MPFPGGIARSGSKVGSRYKGQIASTNHLLCPTLRAQVDDSDVPDGVGSVLEIVIDGLAPEPVIDTRVRVHLVCKCCGSRESALLDPEEQGLEREVGLRLRGLQQSELELDPRIRAVLDRGQRGGQQIARAKDLSLDEALGLRGNPVGLLGRDRERVRHLPERLHDEKMAQMGREIADELGDVPPRGGQLLDREEGGPGVVVGQ